MKNLELQLGDNKMLITDFLKEVMSSVPQSGLNIAIQSARLVILDKIENIKKDKPLDFSKDEAGFVLEVLSANFFTFISRDLVDFTKMLSEQVK